VYAYFDGMLQTARHAAARAAQIHVLSTFFFAMIAFMEEYVFRICSGPRHFGQMLGMKMSHQHGMLGMN